MLRFEMIETEELRIRFTDARACLCINEVGAYYAPDATENYTPATSELKQSIHSTIYLIKVNIVKG